MGSNARVELLEHHTDALAIEMEGAGLTKVFGCANTRGICDYANSHKKNDEWQRYAATAASKEVLRTIREQGLGSYLIFSSCTN